MDTGNTNNYNKSKNYTNRKEQMHTVTYINYIYLYSIGNSATFQNIHRSIRISMRSSSHNNQRMQNGIQILEYIFTSLFSMLNVFTLSPRTQIPGEWRSHSMAVNQSDQRKLYQQQRNQNIDFAKIHHNQTNTKEETYK